MATYQEILMSLLETVAENPNSDVDELLSEKAKEFGLSDDDIEEIKNTNSLLDKFEAKSHELDEARRSGKTRESFVKDEIEQLIRGKADDEKKIILSAIEKAAESMDDNKE